jgi:hypothetical protein
VRGPIERRNIGLAAIDKEFTGEDCFGMRDDKKAATVVRETRREVGLGSYREAHPDQGTTPSQTRSASS